ncbi:FolC bifunctional protein [Nadsonia fulvescens var. elongata DSM 6958]|uniref:Dihydrofolate synthetase n=1 Tax=Nadsonia fulvescens var. elongata DSM 6958 TaxID=857566 RepID=A0A1E3PQM9_9ASCO|nr:FolC bifunctional protein [Nadsonia fulvescens var. elongata DSM 6958]
MPLLDYALLQLNLTSVYSIIEINIENTMGIDLGLARIARLLSTIGNPHLASWKAVHVAGTNGKGSVCAYIDSCLNASEIKSGRFTTPHLIHRHDSISVNGRPVKRGLFLEVEDFVCKSNERNGVGATEFELLTAIAYEVFKRTKVEIGVVEVGLGGRLDATNVLQSCYDRPQDYLDDGVLRQGTLLATAITKIGIDHEGFLGTTLPEIAREKAGIIKSRVPCIVDSSNDPSVLETIKTIAVAKNAPLTLAQPAKTRSSIIDTKGSFGPISMSLSPLLGSYQLSNLSTALHTLSSFSSLYPRITSKSVEKGVINTEWPGRLQKISMPKNVLGKELEFIIDGAHNGQAACLLAEYIDQEIRKVPEEPVTYIMGFTNGKNFTEILKPLLKPNDRFIATKFGNVDGMPWITSCELHQITSNLPDLGAVVKTSNVKEALEYAIANDWGNVVVCGSLYLASETLKLQGTM